jgi:acetamidase/formamidase
MLWQNVHRHEARSLRARIGRERSRVRSSCDSVPASMVRWFAASRRAVRWLALALVCGQLAASAGCARDREASGAAEAVRADHVLTADQTHHKFSRSIPPVLTVRPGAVVEAFTHEATGGQLRLGSSVADLEAVNWDITHVLTGPIHVEGASPGDILAVTLIELEPGDWGWTAIWPDFGLLGPEINVTALKTFRLDKASRAIEFADGIRVPLAPFPGVMGVAPATDELLDTVPPRENGGNMDDPHLVAGTTVYFPVFVAGAHFSIGDTHAVQGMGEVGGSAVEIPMRIVFRLDVIRKGSPGWRPMSEPQYETDDYYATTGFATTLDEASKKATRFMVDHLAATRGLSRADAYMLCSIACDLKIAQVVDEPHKLVAMHVRKAIVGAAPTGPVRGDSPR